MKSNMIFFTKLCFDYFVNNKDQAIKVGSVGAIDADNKHSHGYYIFGFSSSPQTLQQNKTIDARVIDPGGLLANGRYFSSATAH